MQVSVVFYIVVYGSTVHASLGFPQLMAGGLETLQNNKQKQGPFMWNHEIGQNL